MVCTIDPGINTGFALWDTVYFERQQAKQPIDTYGINTYCNGKENQLSDLGNKIYNLLDPYTFDRIIIENTELWSGNLKSQTSIATGNLFLETLIIGEYFHYFTFNHNVQPKLIVAKKWKGQMSKDVTKRRVQMVTGKLYPSEHITDAVGIGLSLQGLL
jgi:hypothetical protein